ncbi:MAG: hypothetical protein L6R42_011259 [Xanthoria sp. 1 TBL-2021]|nr:MAG: hypothetical protein L6R42_011259 [Xanthoria sp. 1 TBL-2021]
MVATAQKSAADYFITSLPGQPDGILRSHPSIMETSSSGISKIAISPTAKEPSYG